MAEETWTAPRIRKTFLDFFQERDHTVGMVV
jgi:alanyl-tRNA synthetase